MPELTTLEYPRHVHKPEGAYLRVENAVECANALDAGWELTPPVDVPAEDDTDAETDAADETPDGDVPTPAKRKRKAKR